MRRIGPHHDGRCLRLGATEGIGDLHGLGDGTVPLLIIGRSNETRIESTSDETSREQGVVTAGAAKEEPSTPCGVETVDRLFARLGSCRLEDPQHPVGQGVGLDHLVTPVLRHRRRRAVVIANLEAVRTPGHIELTPGCHLLDPAGGDPRPGTTGVHEKLDACHWPKANGLYVRLMRPAYAFGFSPDAAACRIWSSRSIRPIFSWPTLPSSRAAISSGVQRPSAYMARTSAGWFHTAIFEPTTVYT